MNRVLPFALITVVTAVLFSACASRPRVGDDFRATVTRGRIGIAESERDQAAADVEALRKVNAKLELELESAKDAARVAERESAGCHQ